MASHDPALATLVRVMVLANVRLYREGLTRLLAGQEMLSIMGTGPIDAVSVERIHAERPDVVLLEASAACESGIVQELARQVPDTKVVAYGVIDESDQAVRCAEMGVGAFVSGDATGDELVGAILAVARGEFNCSPRVAALLMRRVRVLSQVIGPEANPSRLTSRELGIVSLIADGLSNKEIASRLGIELCTVKNHVHHILEKLRVTRRTQAVAHFQRSGLLRPLLPTRARSGS